MMLDDPLEVSCIFHSTLNSAFSALVDLVTA